MKLLCLLLTLFTVQFSEAQSDPLTPNLDFKGLWVSKFQDSVLGNTVEEDRLLAYASGADFNYLILTNTYFMLDDDSTSLNSTEMLLASFIEKAHDVYQLNIHGNVGSDATALKLKQYNESADVDPIQRYDGITYECEFYNSNTNGPCNTVTSYLNQLVNIKTYCDGTLGSNNSSDLVCEVYIGGGGSPGAFVNSNPTPSQVATLIEFSDHLLLTYYKSSPSTNGGNFFNYSEARLEMLTSPSLETKILLLLKSRDTDGNNMYGYIANHSGTHVEALKDPYYSWLDGTTFNPALTDGFMGNYANYQLDPVMYPFGHLETIRLVGYTWFEQFALLEISDSLTLGVSDHPYTSKLIVYPNPAKDEIRFKSKDWTKLSIFGLDGRFIREEGYKNVVNVIDLPKGEYLLEFQWNNGSITREKLMK